ncbi:sensor histidine kinase [Rhodobium gokarnense]|uniref:histidine kinase n=1 Tax=Rhodobium gokarnense TaxID=364296 RepID=A0ABT3HI22_9HYPH|nr:sensor histidine kinase [Rhodobium gokarnense]MCW2310043.1 two-component system sensor histidine kinase TctE [Rhodobium gokarnense]
MNRPFKPAIAATGSLRRRLIVQLLVIAALLSVVLYVTVSTFARQAAETTQDNILEASAAAISEAARAERDQVFLDIPYSALSMLGAVSEERVFYRVMVDGVTITGYADLPAPEVPPKLRRPSFETTVFRGDEVRVVATVRRITVADETVRLTVLVAQTRAGLAAISLRISIAAAAVGIGFFLVSGTLSWFAARSALRPLDLLAQSVARRGAHDLRPVRSDAPSELVPLLVALNSFMDRLRASLMRTEEFIAEAAHRVRTPLATVRAQAEIALRSVKQPHNRQTMREVIRAVDESSRSAGQLLDHAMVTFRSDNLARTEFDLAELALDTIRGIGPTADLKDIAIRFSSEAGLGKVKGDAILVQSALRNLLDNAVKYSPEESIIEVAIARKGRMARVSVRDQGRGFGDGDMERLKGRFDRGTNVADVVGSGLGLTIVDEVARAHGGSLDLASNERGNGACVSLALPLA